MENLGDLSFIKTTLSRFPNGDLNATDLLYHQSSVFRDIPLDTCSLNPCWETSHVQSQNLEVSFSRLDPSSSTHPIFSSAFCNDNLEIDFEKKMHPINVELQRSRFQEALSSLSLEDFHGNIFALARNQRGCVLLQKKMEVMGREEIDMIFLEIIGNVAELMLDPLGKYVIQKLVEVCREEQRTEILLMVTRTELQLVRICLNMDGTRTVQKLLEHLTTQEQISLVMSALSRGAVALSKDLNGHRVIQHCLKNFSVEDNKNFLKEVAHNCLTIATDRSGCCVMQECVENSHGKIRERLITEIIANALLLSADNFGNYVVQHLLRQRIPQVTEKILKQLEGSYMYLSCSKYGSNVVEKCLTESGGEQSARIIYELLISTEVPMLLVHPYGNFVIQTALSVSMGHIYCTLQNLVRINYPVMCNNLYGKKILTWFHKRKVKIFGHGRR